MAVQQGVAAESEGVVEQALRDWPRLLHLHVWLVHQHGQWYAVSADFDIAGMGENEAEAFEQMLELVSDYLGEFRAEGRPFAEARRPLPLAERLKYRAIALASPALGLLRRDEVASEGAFVLTPQLNAHC
jgi:hypothetical protein